MTTDDNFTDSDKVSPSEIKATDTPKCRHARARREATKPTDWHITLHYDHLPLGVTITYEYMGDYHLPVVWDELPHGRVELEKVAYQISEVALDGTFTTAYYWADHTGMVFLTDAQGIEHMVCMVNEWGDASEIAHALNATFPEGNTKAYNAEQRETARSQLMGFIEVFSKRGE